MRAGIVGIAFSSGDRQARYVPLGHEGAGRVGDLLAGADAPSQVETRAALERLKPLFEDERIRKIGHDLKFDAIVLARHGIVLAGLAFDSMLASYLLDATRPGHPLEETSLEHLGYKALTEEDVCGRGAKVHPAGARGAGDGAELRRRARRPRAAAFQPARPAARDRPSRDRVSRAGDAAHSRCSPRSSRPASASTARRSRRSRSTSSRSSPRISARIYELAGEVFNVNSPKQLGEILFDKLQLPALKTHRQDALGVNGR